MNPLIVTGTDTDVGKTVVAAMLTLALDGYYWKPIQSGTRDGTDAARVAELTGLPSERFLPERFVLTQPLSPHRAAELDGIEIDVAMLALPRIPHKSWLIVEGAGGIFVPINRGALQVHLFARWAAPVVVVARTSLGTINHTLLTLEALKQRSIKVLGIIFVGASLPDTERTIVDFSGAKRLGRLPFLSRLDGQSLRQAFAAHFNRADFEAAHT
jgi:dethiobiotin synthetase